MSKPVYTNEFIAFSPFDCVALKQLICCAARPGCRMAEIGSWLGNGSTQVFLRVLDQYPDSSLLCVDNWQGNPNVQRHQDIVAEYDVLGTFRANTELAQSKVNLQTFISTSAAAASLMRDGAFDLVFIDADHSYDSVREDIAAWRPKVRSGGILCGHDCESRLNADLERRIIENTHLDTIAGEGTPFPAIHPGSILAVHEAFDRTARLFAETQLVLDNGVPGRSTIWFVSVQ